MSRLDRVVRGYGIARWSTTDGSNPSRGDELDAAIQQIVREQDGVFRLDQVATLVSWSMADHAVRTGRWSRPHRGVYVAHNSDLTKRQESWVCLLAGPPGSALGGLTAAELDGLRGFDAAGTYLVVPLKSRSPTRPGLVVKRSGELTDGDVHPSRRPRRTRVPRSLVDAASWQGSTGRASSIILAGVQQRLVRPDDLRDALARRGRCRNRLVIRQSIYDAEGGIASVPERDFGRIVRMFTLPEPERQAVIQRSDGRFYLDAHWRKYGVSSEVHGIQHLELFSWDADLDRQAIVAARGLRVLPFSSYAVRHRKEHVGRLLTEALRNAGWRG
ncbi:hypothetical protein [Phytoactinopolyspora halophila]|uniref:hypothetical protein n=1 Tax=Phytoactinopolyspora halophila TaxID=1981511 RepID=UPI000F4F36FB|nr:hypothetical protein [Phytoactinopolyspora halophila]